MPKKNKNIRQTGDNEREIDFQNRGKWWTQKQKWNGKFWVFTGKPWPRKDAPGDDPPEPPQDLPNDPPEPVNKPPQDPPPVPPREPEPKKDDPDDWEFC